jgi:hypothetical protein
MTNYLKRLLFVDDEERQHINILFYPFIFATFFYGLGFSAFGWWSGVSTSSLFHAFMNMHPAVAPVWGACALLAAILAILMVTTRYASWLGSLASMFGFLIWLFAACTYIANGFWLVVLTVAIPNAFFWAWYYMSVKRYARRKDTGQIQDPS